MESPSTLTAESERDEQHTGASVPGPPAVSERRGAGALESRQFHRSGDQINGQTIFQYLTVDGDASGPTGLGRAKRPKALTRTLLSQAQASADPNLRRLSGREAVQVMELQKGYQAAGKMVSVIDSLTSTLINMVPASLKKVIL